MTAPVLLTLLAVVAGALGPQVRRLRWLRRSPRGGILVWQALSWCFLSSVFLAGIALMLPAVPLEVDHGFAALLGACAEAIGKHYSSPAQGVVSLAGVLTVAGLVRLSLLGLRESRELRAARTRQRGALQLVARPGPGAGVWVVDDPRTAAYCLPGSRGMVVISTGVVDRLSPDELSAVLAHERAHLRGRHHLARHLSDVLSRAFPLVPLLRTAAEEVPKLLELRADDVAAAVHGRRALARALVRLAAAPATPVPATSGALHAAAMQTLARVERLTAPSDRRRGPLTAGIVALSVSAVSIAPLVAVAAPAVLALAHHYCPELLPF